MKHTSIVNKSVSNILIDSGEVDHIAQRAIKGTITTQTPPIVPTMS